MTGPAPSVARIRAAVRNVLNDLDPGALVLAAVSGGRDSLALAHAVAFEAPKLAMQPAAIIIDHGMQAASATTADQVRTVLQDMGLDPVVIERVHVDDSANVEARAREARYDALTATAQRLGAAAVLLGHTLDDQAETVLLGLARGSGAKSLSGMATRRGVFRRPLLDISRQITGEACAAASLVPWDDPHNESEEFARVRIRRTLMPTLEHELGPGVATALARTANQLRDDDDALQLWAEKFWQQGEPTSLDCSQLQTLPLAVLRRVIRIAALAAGATPGALRYTQLKDVEALVVDWHGQGIVALPGGVTANRDCGRLTFGPVDASLDSAKGSVKDPH